MSIHYPAGVKTPSTSPEMEKKKKKATSQKKKLHFKVQPGNRGMAFEDDINQTNQYYLDHDLAVIHKKPTPINIVKVDYTHGAKITQAYFEEPSTTDYNGIYQGRYIDFEAKSTHSKTSFPLSNIAPQQITHLKAVMKHGAIAFFLINIVPLNETYLLPAEYVCAFYEEKPRKSIPLEEIKKHGHLVKEGYAPRLAYLPILDEFFLK